MIIQLLHQYGYVIVALFVGLESLGVPLPGESTLIAAAVYAGSSHQLGIVLIACVAAAAAVIGDSAGFLLGRKFGESLLGRRRRFLHVSEDHLAVGRYLFRRHGGRIVFFGRFFTVLRTYAAFLAGVTQMPWRRFVMFNAAGGVLWASLYSFGAYALGSTANTLGQALFIAGTALTVVLGVITTVLTRRYYRLLLSRAKAEDRPRALLPV
jgi:membrane protein DedA with SNARE-associated domain